MGSSWDSPYAIDPKTIKITNGQLRGTILKTLGNDVESVQLPLKISFLESGIARVTVDELKRQEKDIELRHGSQARKERYNEAASWALVADEKIDTMAKAEKLDTELVVEYGPDHLYKAVIHHAPFSIDFLRDDELQIRFNNKGLLNIEHWRPKVENAKKAVEGAQEGEGPKEGEVLEKVEETKEGGEDESTWWEETFGGNTDSKPKGPESVGLDISFPGYEHVYGIPGHASSLSLKQTRYV